MMMMMMMMMMVVVVVLHSWNSVRGAVSVVTWKEGGNADQIPPVIAARVHGMTNINSGVTGPDLTGGRPGAQFA